MSTSFGLPFSKEDHFNRKEFDFLGYEVASLEGYMEGIYGKCPKILYTKLSDKMKYANSVDSDQTLIRTYTVC